MSAFASSNLVGKTVDDRYEVTERLHEGGMGTVYLATDTRLDRQVVVKVPHASLLAERGFAERFQREIRSLMKLDHPHIVKVYDAGKLTHVPFAVFQYLSGGSLFDRIQKAGGKQSATEVAEWLGQVGAALDFMHTKNLLHRDVKPGNLLYDEAGNLILADFGVVKPTQRNEHDLELTMKGQIPGSPEFMAPESTGTEDLGPAYDQYALAVSAYLALTGQLPVTYKNPLEALVRKKDPRPILAVDPTVPPGVAAAVMRALATKPGDRFPDCRAFAEAVKAGLEGAPAPAGEVDVSGITFGEKKPEKPEKKEEKPTAAPSGKPPERKPERKPEKKAKKPVEEAPAPGSPMRTASESITLAFGAARPAPPEAQPLGKPDPSQPVPPVPGGMQTQILTRPPKRGTSKTLLYAVCGLVGLLLIIVVVQAMGGSNKKGSGAVAEAPVIDLVEPVDGFITRSGVIHVQGKVDNPRAQVIVEGREVKVAADGIFVTDVDLPIDQEVVINVTAQVPGGKMTEVKRRVRRDITAPKLTLEKAAGGEVPTTNASVYEVHGKTNEPGAQITVAGLPATVDEDGNFAAEVPLEGEGEITLPVVAEDRAGNKAEASLTVRRDVTAPKLTITGPDTSAGPWKTNDGLVEVRGEVDDPTATVTVNGHPAPLDPNGGFRLQLELEDAGLQELPIVATDPMGNTSRGSVSVEQTATLVIFEPIDGMSTNATSVKISGKVYGTDTTVTINGQETATDQDGRFEVDWPLPDDGRHTLEIVATARDGEKTTTRLRVARDATPPRLSVDGSGVILTSPGSTHTITGTVREENPVRVLVNGKQARLLGDASLGTHWTATLVFPVGTRELWVEAIDQAGNRTVEAGRPIDLGTPRFLGLNLKGKGEKSGLFEYTLEKDETVELVLIPQGVYLRGASPDDPDAKDDERPRKRAFAGPFLIAKTPITWAQYLFFCEKTGRPKPKSGPLSHPATNITWDDAQAYCEWAGLRLPTEAEWEYAARAGANTRYPWGNDWQEGKANVAMRRGNTTAIGSFEWANAFGLVEITGNVWEWCSDWYAPDAYEGADEHEPIGPADGVERVIRGGSWRDSEADARLSARGHSVPSRAADTIGFRPVCDASNLR